MRRTNTFAVRPLSEQDEQLLHDLLDASASLWNELNYERRQQFFEGESVWDTADYRKRYVGVLGSATAQQVIRKNSEAWRSFFAAQEDREDTAPPGYWGNEDEGRELRTYIRNDQYALETGERSRLEIPVGQDLKEEYGITVKVESEAYTTAECPVCGERDDTERDGDVFRCSCGYEGHADLGASRTFLELQAGESAVGSMARPVRLKWDDHNWSELSRSPERARPHEERTNRSTGDGKLASVGAP